MSSLCDKDQLVLNVSAEARRDPHLLQLGVSHFAPRYCDPESHIRVVNLFHTGVLAEEPQALPWGPTDLFDCGVTRFLDRSPISFSSTQQRDSTVRVLRHLNPQKRPILLVLQVGLWDVSCGYEFFCNPNNPKLSAGCEPSCSPVHCRSRPECRACMFCSPRPPSRTLTRDERIKLSRPTRQPWVLDCNRTAEFESYVRTGWIPRLVQHVRSVVDVVRSVQPVLHTALHTLPQQACWAGPNQAYQAWFRRFVPLRDTIATKALVESHEVHHTIRWDQCGGCGSTTMKSCDAHFSNASYRALWTLIAAKAHLTTRQEGGVLLGRI